MTHDGMTEAEGYIPQLHEDIRDLNRKLQKERDRVAHERIRAMKDYRRKVVATALAKYGEDAHDDVLDMIETINKMELPEHVHRQEYRERDTGEKVALVAIGEVANLTETAFNDAHVVTYQVEKTGQVLCTLVRDFAHAFDMEGEGEPWRFIDADDPETPPEDLVDVLLDNMTVDVAWPLMKTDAHGERVLAGFVTVDEWGEMTDEDDLIPGVVAWAPGNWH